MDEPTFPLYRGPAPIPAFVPPEMLLPAAVMKKVRIGAERQKLEAAYLRLLRAYKLPAPVAQFRFHPDRMWRFDFAWPDQKVAVEIEGGIWRRSGKGAHTGGAAVTRDAEKGNEAQLLGWLVLRFTDKMLRDGTAIDWTRRALGEVAEPQKMPANGLNRAVVAFPAATAGIPTGRAPLSRPLPPDLEPI